MQYRKNLGPILFISFFILLWLTVFGMWSAHAADSSIAPRSVNPYGVTLNGKYGKLVPLNPQLYASYSVNANGSMDFDCTQREHFQRVYLYSVTPYGNGTLTLRFQLDTIPSTVIAPGAASTSLSSTFVETVTYTLSQTVPLELDFVGLASTGVANGAVLGSAFFPLMMITIGSWFSIAMFGNVVSVVRGEVPLISTRKVIIISTVVVVGWIVVIAIAAGASGALKGLGN